MEEKYLEDQGQRILEEIERDLVAEEERLAKIEKRFWKGAGDPTNLSEALSRRTLLELQEIAENFSIKGLSGLRKNQVLEKLLAEMPKKFPEVFHHREWQEVKAYLAIVEKPEGVKKEALSFELRRSFSEAGLLFAGLVEGEKILYVPKEMASWVKDLDQEALEKRLRRNEEWMYLTRGLLYYYGVLTKEEHLKYLAEHSTTMPTYPDYLWVLLRAAKYDEHFALDQDLLWHGRMLDAKSILAQREKRGDLEDHPFSKRELLEAGKKGFVKKSKELRDLLDTLKRFYDFTKEEEALLASDLVHIIQLGGEGVILLKYLKKTFPRKEETFQRDLEDTALNFFLVTPQWRLKGHSFLAVHKGASLIKRKVTSFERKKEIPVRVEKVPRNAPCPCGSGKKYKQCCGQ